MNAFFAPVPDHLKPLYWKSRIVLWTLLIVGGGSLLFSFLFPTMTASFDFRNPRSSRNMLADPRLSDTTPRPNGIVESGRTLLANASIVGDFSEATISLVLEKKSDTPTAVDVTLRRSYRAFLYPEGEPVTGFPPGNVFRIDDVYYLLRDNALHRFVSEAAFLSRYPEERAQRASRDLLSRFPLAEDFVGFRVGSLLSFADGVFVVTSETDIRPIGSAEIFLALGYRFEDVVPVSEEDIGIYERGRIFVLNIPHPDGTLFRDTDTERLYVIDQGTKRPLMDDDYRRFLEEKQTPIMVSSTDANKTARCSATRGLKPRTFTCTAPLVTLPTNSVPDYELAFIPSDADINISSASFSLTTRMTGENVRTLLAKVKQRVMNRFGISQ